MCGMIARFRRRPFGARTLSRWGPHAAVTIRAASRRVRARRQNCKRGSDDGTRATPGRGRWELQRRSAAAVRFRKPKTKSPRRISPCGLCDFCDDGLMPVICPTCQTVSDGRRNTESFIQTETLEIRAPATVCGAGVDIRDYGSIESICPTCQAAAVSLRRRIHRMNRLWHGRLRLHPQPRFGGRDRGASRLRSLIGGSVARP